MNTPEHPATNSFPLDAIVSEVDAMRMFFTAFPDVVSLAREARMVMATSYRGVDVGVAFFFVNPYTGDFGAEASGNKKPKAFLNTRCAEPQSLRKIAEQDGAAKVVGGVLATPDDPDLVRSVLKFDAPFIIPCPTCTDFMNSHSAVHGSTLIVSTAGGSNGHKGEVSNRMMPNTLAGIRHAYRQMVMPMGNPAAALTEPIDNVNIKGLPRKFDELVRDAEKRGAIFSAADLAVKAMLRCAT